VVVPDPRLSVTTSGGRESVTELFSPYPRLRQLLVLSLLVLPIMQLALLPLLGDLPAHLSLAIAELFLLAVAVVAILRRRWSAEDLFLLNAATGKGILIVIPTAMVAAILAGETDLLVAHGWQWLEWEAPLALQRSSLEIQTLTGASDILPAILSIGLLPAICEELFFRGFVYTGLRYHHGSRIALVGSSLLFAVAHLNPWQLPTFFLLGLFLGWLVHRTHSIYPAIIAHALNNLLSVCAVNVRAHFGVDPLGALEPVSDQLLVGCLLVFVVGLLLLRRIRPIMPALSPFTTTSRHSTLARPIRSDL
jgi:membrane protease YdiL (CAAX protease family)